MLGPGLEIVAAETPQPRDAFPYTVQLTGQPPVRGGRGGGAAATTPRGATEVGRNVDPTARAAPSTTATTATATTRAAIRIIAAPRLLALTSRRGACPSSCNGSARSTPRTRFGSPRAEAAGTSTCSRAPGSRRS